jgi:hypothetical protein
MCSWFRGGPVSFSGWEGSLSFVLLSHCLPLSRTIDLSLGSLGNTKFCGPWPCPPGASTPPAWAGPAHSTSHWKSRRSKNTRIQRIRIRIRIRICNTALYKYKTNCLVRVSLHSYPQDGSAVAWSEEPALSGKLKFNQLIVRHLLHITTRVKLKNLNME